jgi:hypothetical protein
MRSSLRAWLAAPALVVCACLPATAWADCVFGIPFGGEPTLQTALNGLLSPAPNTATACLPDAQDAHWVSVSPTSATILLEIAGFASQNQFGLYDGADASRRVRIFDGLSGPGTTAALTFAQETGGVRVTVTIGSSSWSSSSVFTGGAFGFYLRTPESNVFFSDSALNGGLDRMYAYRGNGAAFTTGSDVFGANDAILAYEDLVHGDNDYQDFVVLVRGVQAVPLPAAAWLFGSALLAFGVALRRRRDLAC